MSKLNTSRKLTVAAVSMLASLAITFAQAQAVDHNNLDAGRPLSFDDADSIAYGEKALEFGGAISRPNNGRTGVIGTVEYLYGFARNTHLTLDFDPRWTDQNGTGRRGSLGDIGIGVFHNFNREYGNTPAFSLRADAYLPTGRGSQGVDFRVRGIATRRLGQYGKMHLNLDWNVNNSNGPAQRRPRPGVILGYSKPLGYPTRFDRTGIAEIGVRAGNFRGEKAIVRLGLGMRQQVGVSSVFDVGVQSDISGGQSREKLRLVAGYSRQF